MRQRLSISELHEGLRIDPYFFSDATTCLTRDLRNLAFTNDVDIKPLELFIQTPQMELLLLWIRLEGLRVYSGGDTMESEFSKIDFVSNSYYLLEIDRDEFQTFLRARKLPLPSFWFPESLDSTEEFVKSIERVEDHYFGEAIGEGLNKSTGFQHENQGKSGARKHGVIVHAWIKGIDILESPYSRTRPDLYVSVKNGNVVPYENFRTLYPDPCEPPGMQRFFYFHDHTLTRDKLGYKRYQREWLRNWLSQPDNEILKEDAEDAERHSRMGLSKVYEGIEERRTRREAELVKLEQEIKELEPKLDPAVAWSGLNLSAEQQEELTTRFLECYYRKEEIDRVFLQGAPNIDSLEEQESSGKVNKIGITFQEDPVVRAAIRFLSQNPEAKLEDVAFSDEVTRCFDPDKIPAVSTIMKRLQGKIPVKRGRRKSS